MDLMAELHQGGATICMVTHDPRWAEHAERTIHLFDGMVVDEKMANRRAVREGWPSLPPRAIMAFASWPMTNCSP